MINKFVRYLIVALPVSVLAIPGDEDSRTLDAPLQSSFSATTNPPLSTALASLPILQQSVAAGRFLGAKKTGRPRTMTQLDPEQELTVKSLVSGEMDKELADETYQKGASKIIEALKIRKIIPSLNGKTMGPWRKYIERECISYKLTRCTDIQKIFRPRLTREKIDRSLEDLKKGVPVRYAGVTAPSGVKKKVSSFLFLNVALHKHLRYLKEINPVDRGVSETTTTTSPPPPPSASATAILQPAFLQGHSPADLRGACNLLELRSISVNKGGRPCTVTQLTSEQESIFNASVVQEMDKELADQSYTSGKHVIMQALREREIVPIRGRKIIEVWWKKVKDACRNYKLEKSTNISDLPGIFTGPGELERVDAVLKDLRAGILVRYADGGHNKSLNVALNQYLLRVEPKAVPSTEPFQEEDHKDE